MEIESIEKLDGSSNYSTWKFAMRKSLEYENLWNMVEKGPTTARNEADEEIVENAAHEKETDEIALAKICLSINTSCYVHVVDAKNAKEAWDRLQQVYSEPKTARRVFELSKLLFSTKRSSFPSMEEYINEMLRVSHRLSDADEPVKDKWITFALLNGLDDDDYLVTSCTLGAKCLSLEDVKRALIEYSYRKENLTDCLTNSESEDDDDYADCEENDEEEEEDAGESEGVDSEDVENEYFEDEDVGEGDCKDEDEEEPPNQGEFDTECHFCGERGHTRQACPDLNAVRIAVQQIQAASAPQVQVERVEVPVPHADPVPLIICSFCGAYGHITPVCPKRIASKKYLQRLLLQQFKTKAPAAGQQPVPKFKKTKQIHKTGTEISHRKPTCESAPFNAPSMKTKSGPAKDCLKTDTARRNKPAHSNVKTKTEPASKPPKPGATGGNKPHSNASNVKTKTGPARNPSKSSGKRK